MGRTEVKISVTQQDIDDGKRIQARYCPIALAVSRETGMIAVVTFKYLTLFTGKEELYRNEALKRWSMPPEAQVFVRRFDSGLGEKVEPFEFEL
jgi:hypothetical protein